MKIEKGLEQWIEYCQSKSKDKDWNKAIRITEKHKRGNMPYCKSIFKESFENEKPNLNMFINNMFKRVQIHNISYRALEEIKCSGINLNSNDSDRCFGWSLIIKNYIGFLIEFEIKRALEDGKFVVEESEELDSRFKVDLKISKGYKNIIIQIKNFSYVLGYAKNNGYGGIHRKGLTEYQQSKGLECSKVGFVFYRIVEDGIRLCKPFGAEGIITTPTEVELYHNWDSNDYKNMSHLVEEIGEILI